MGTIGGRKAQPNLVEAFARLNLQAIKLVIVGKKDWQAEKLFAKIGELGLEASVIFPGYVADDDLPLFYNAAEVFVFPSIFEGFGLPVVESMASGVPTITSHGSSLEEVAGDGALLVVGDHAGGVGVVAGEQRGACRPHVEISLARHHC